MDVTALNHFIRKNEYNYVFIDFFLFSHWVSFFLFSLFEIIDASYKKTLKGRKNERQTFRAHMGALFSAIIKRLIQNF